MKKVFLTVALALLVVGFISSCTPESVEDQDREQGIENEEVKEGDI